MLSTMPILDLLWASSDKPANTLAAFNPTRYCTAENKLAYLNSMEKEVFRSLISNPKGSADP